MGVDNKTELCLSCLVGGVLLWYCLTLQLSMKRKTYLFVFVYCYYMTREFQSDFLTLTEKKILSFEEG